MLEIEVIGSEDAIADLKQHLASLSGVDFKEYEEKAAIGTAGVFGLLATIPKPLFETVFSFLRGLVSKDRNLEVEVKGIKLKVRDIQEASSVLELLSSRGLL